LTIVTLLVWAAGVYLAAGFVTAVFALIRGLGRIDPDAEKATWGFRLIVLPGLVVLWPVLVRRFRSGEQDPPSEETPHKRMWRSAP